MELATPKVIKLLKRDIPLHVLWPSHAWCGLVIPRGTFCRMIDRGSTKGKFWIDSFDWLDKKKYPLVHHDAVHYGIVVEASEVE
jgi:hypothetical protein